MSPRTGRLGAALALAALCLLLAGPRPASAALDEAVLARFAADSYPETEAAVAALAAGGDPLAADVLQALSEGRLAVGADRRAYIRPTSGGGGSVLDAATGQIRWHNMLEGYGFGYVTLATGATQAPGNTTATEASAAAASFVTDATAAAAAGGIAAAL